MSTAEITALIQLLLDDDPGTFQAVVHRFRELGGGSLPALRAAAESEDAKLRVRSRSVLQALLSDEVARELRILLERPEPNLEEAVILLARVEHPELQPDTLQAQLERLGEHLRLRLASCSTSRGRALCLGRVIHGEEGFRGNVREYYDPRNSYLDEVLRRRLGIPISLAAVYILAGRRAGLDLCGVGMPMHFLALLKDQGERLLIDPYRGGRLVTREECRTLLAGFNHSFREDYLQPVTDRDMLRRMVANLVRIYHERDDRIRLGRLYGFVNALQSGQG